MGFWHSLAGTVAVEVVGADISYVLAQINRAEITLRNITYTGAITVRAEINRSDLRKITGIVEKLDGKIRVVNRNGAYWALKRLLYRPVLVIGIAVILLAALLLPRRVYFVNVEGNISIPTKLILEKAEECGIRFGAVRMNVRSEKMKNALLSAVPELQWAGVNTSGCVATISVREKSVLDEKKEEVSGITSIVALRDGVISDLTVVQGNGVCQVGQAVKKGQLLVSGYTDVGLTIKATQAKAEIYAQTLRNIQMITPSPTSLRGEVSGKKTRYALRIGKKLIKLYKDSGISDGSCVKMYSEEYLTLPGNFQLPVSVVRETLITCDAPEESSVQANNYDWMESAASDYLQNQMIAGRILAADVQTQIYEDSCTMEGTYACVEMIGKVKQEEIVQKDGENN